MKPAGSDQLIWRSTLMVAVALAIFSPPSIGQQRPGSGPAAAAPAPMESAGPVEMGPSMSLTIGKSTLLRLPDAISRISVGNPMVADVTLINPRELYLLGKVYGSTNVILWSRTGPTTIIDVTVGLDAAELQNRIRELLPKETGVIVKTAADTVVLAGEVSSALQADYVVSIAEAFTRGLSGGIQTPIFSGNADGQPLPITAVARSNLNEPQRGPRIVNMMRVAQPQQVMLEVKVAEISKTLLDKLGVGLTGSRTNGDWRYSIISNFLTDSAGVLGAVSGIDKSLKIDAEKRDGLIRLLAEPNIVSISGQEASFLAGGKVFIPVARNNETTGGSTITLEEKEFGVGLKFLPTVLDGGRINLRVAPEVSEPIQGGSPFTTVGSSTAVLPSFATRRAQTTVQLMDGQSFAIAGLIKNNVTEVIRAFPVLGEVPVLGALFRSNEFATDRSELMFVVTARLVKPATASQLVTPADNFVPPTREEFFIKGQMEGSGHPDVPPTERQMMMNEGQTAAAAGSAGGFQLK
jgi:pilus assembly protein CpaC